MEGEEEGEGEGDEGVGVGKKEKDPPQSTYITPGVHKPPKLWYRMRNMLSNFLIVS